MKYLWGPWQLMVYFLAATVLFATTTDAAPYVEYKYKQSLDTSSKTSRYLRAGYKFQNNFYLETGKSSAELGYKKKFGNLVVKGKIESTDSFDKNGLETEIRYTFK
jgi:hypothetical protein|tara:strand:- start:559 stop:876 length:318 start_codon:yes stop_codon:yes gene_type:complete